MAIGTSLGAYYEDDFMHAAGIATPNADAGKSVIQKSVDDIIKDYPSTSDIDIFRSPLEVQKSPDIENNEVTPGAVMSGVGQASDPKNIYDDSGNIVDYDLSH